MSDNINTGATPTPTPAAGQPVTDPNATASGNAMNSVEDLPKYWQDQIRSLRNEGQNKGSRITALESELAAARSEVATKEATLTQQVSDGALALARYRAAVSSGIPVDQVDNFASRLRGSTAEELEQDAATLAEMFKANPATSENRRGVDPSQGAGNGAPAPSSVADQLQSQVRQLLGR